MTGQLICEPNLLIDVGLPILTFIGGFLISWLTLSKKDRLEHKQRLYKNAKELAQEQEDAYKGLMNALKVYINSEEVTEEMFVNISMFGDNYFRRLKTTSEAILNGSVDSVIRDESLLPMLSEAVEKTLPAYYEALSDISEQKGFEFNGELTRSNYESIYSSVEKYLTKNQRKGSA